MADDSVARGPVPPLAASKPTNRHVRVSGFDGIRFTIEEAEESLTAAAERLALPKSAWPGEDYNILAVSGGAAGGAFGAGVLAGLTRAGTRPDFAIVTGVSTGALIAVYAFLGSDWDDRLADAYTGGHAAHLLHLTRLLPGFGEALFQAQALEALVYPFVDQALMEAVAAQHVRGRRLLVATTNLDSQQSCIWDMGELASRGGEAALALFRDILVASASLPGVFPPRHFACERGGVAFDEMHVDGGVSAPLFVMPEALMRWRALGRRLRRSQIYVLINTQLEPPQAETAHNLPAILLRSLATLLRFSYRQALNTAVVFCAAHDLPLRVAAIPNDLDHDLMFNFETKAMRSLFDAGVERAHGANLWMKPRAEPSAWSTLFDAFGVQS